MLASAIEGRACGGVGAAWVGICTACVAGVFWFWLELAALGVVCGACVKCGSGKIAVQALRTARMQVFEGVQHYYDMHRGLEYCDVSKRLSICT